MRDIYARRSVRICPEWEYPPVRLADGTDLTGEQARLFVRWYWENGQGDEDLNGDCEDVEPECENGDAV